MKLFLFTLFLACFLSPTLNFSQSNQTKFDAEILAAKTDLQDQQFRSAIRHLEKAQTFSASGENAINPQIQHLLVKSYLGLNYYDDARREIKKYFEVAKESDTNYGEMLSLLGKIDDFEENALKKEDLKKKEGQREEDAWLQAVKEGNEKSYRAFMTQYPNNIHAQEARTWLTEDYQRKIDVEKGIANTYRSQWKGRKGAKTVLLIGGSCITAFGTAKYLDILINGDYNSLGTSTGDYGEASAVKWMVAGTGINLIGLLFIHPRKYKKRYKKQIIKIGELEKKGISYAPSKSPVWSIAAANYGTGLTLKYTF
jgi:hypothetical protein